MIINCHKTRARILAQVTEERLRQNALVESGGLPFNCSDIDISHSGKLPVLGEEFGEVSKAVYGLYTLDSTIGGAELEERALLSNLRTELIQLAAVAVAWVESMDNDTP